MLVGTRRSSYRLTLTVTLTLTRTLTLTLTPGCWGARVPTLAITRTLTLTLTRARPLAPALTRHARWARAGRTSPLASLERVKIDAGAIGLKAPGRGAKRLTGRRGRRACE